MWWRCARDPAHRWKARIDDRVGKEAGCPVCTGKAPVPRGAREGRLNSFADRFPELAREWDRARNGTTRPKDVSFGSKFSAWWICSRDPAHRWQAEVSERARGSGCPVCAGKAPVPPNARLGRLNSLAEKFPRLVAEWDQQAKRRCHAQGRISPLSFQGVVEMLARPIAPLASSRERSNARDRLPALPTRPPTVSRVNVRGLFMRLIRLLSAVVLWVLSVPLVGGCETPDTKAVLDNHYPASSGLVIFQGQWSIASFATPVAPGTSSDPQEAVAASANTAYVVLAPGCDPSVDGGATPTTFIVLQSISGFAVAPGRHAPHSRRRHDLRRQLRRRELSHPRSGRLHHPARVSQPLHRAQLRRRHLHDDRRDP